MFDLPDDANPASKPGARNFSCPYYVLCLDIAAANMWPDFTCQFVFTARRRPIQKSTSWTCALRAGKTSGGAAPDPNVAAGSHPIPAVRLISGISARRWTEHPGMCMLFKKRRPSGPGGAAGWNPNPGEGLVPGLEPVILNPRRCEMAKNPVLSNTLLKTMALVALAPLLFGGLFWAVGEYRAAHLEAEDLRKRFIQNHRDLLRAEVGSVLSYIRGDKVRLEKKSRDQLRGRVNHALQVAEGIYSQNKDRKSPGEIKKLIRDALTPVRFDRGNGYYFAFDMKGAVQIYPARHVMEGDNVLELRDGSGYSLPRELIALVNDKGHGFHTYLWKKKPGKNRRYHPKVSYVKLFEPYGWIIGTGKYLDEMEAEIQARVLSHVAEMRFGTEGYYFACDYKGNPLFSNGKITKGSGNLLDLTDPDGVKVIQSQVQAAQKPGGGFYYYSWPKLDEPGPFHKMSFAMGFSPWQWAVGAGIYLDTIEKEIGIRERDLWSRLASRAVEGSLVMALFLLLTYLWADRIIKRINQSLKTFSGFFRRAGSRSARIDLERVHFREFKDMARWANQMVSDRKNQEREKELLEAQLRQSQKMEAIGTLAGGIAHDFNNILAAIVGYAELSLEDCQEGEVDPRFLMNILEASMRAKELVRGILAFSRSAEASYYTLDLNREVCAAAEILKRTLPKMIRLDLDLDPDLGPILGDSGQIQQVLLNLVSNSKDAMPDGGTITLATSTVAADQAGLQAEENAAPQAYSVLKVKDAGQGIPEDLLDQIFDPFFTTKEVGKGTGLGLSTVYGIVRSHMGHIETKSDPGKGTEFTIYFPETDSYLPPPEAEMDNACAVSGNGETVLLVDDERAIREIGARILADAGYRPLVAASGEEALELYGAEKISLVILDLDMPGIGGRECLARLLRLDPEAKVVIASGHGGDRDTDLRSIGGAREFIAKPYLKTAMLRLVGRVLDQNKGRAKG